MGFSFFRFAIWGPVAFAIALVAVPAFAATPELATARGPIAISEARPGLRAPLCSELIVEARDALDNHLIAETHPTAADSGACRYALTVPAQTAVWFRVQPVLVAGIRNVNGENANALVTERARSSSGSVALRFAIIAPLTYFFTPNEERTVSLKY
jgi:hypothetical protein